MKYQKINSIHIEKLKKIVGEKNVLTQKEDLLPFGQDETSEIFSLPEVVVKPSSTQEVSQILSLAWKNRIPVTPRGGGTGLSGGAIPLKGGILLSLERMNHILEIDPENWVAVVEAGVITRVLQEELEKQGLFYPISPSSRDSCTLGGNVAESAGGANVIKYGGTKNYVLGLTFVLPSGEVIKWGGKLLKDVVGYDLIGLLTGSEGTLGIITEIILRVLPLPPKRIDLLIGFRKVEDLLKSVREILREGIVPANLEFMDRETIKILSQTTEEEFPFPEADAHLLVEVDGERKENLEPLVEKIGEICLQKGAEDVLIAEERRGQERLWKSRRMIRENLKKVSAVIADEDVAVSRDKILPLLKKVEKLKNKYSLRVCSFGHLGDGNIHINILKFDTPDNLWKERLPLFVKELFGFVKEVGGSISGEHGVGITKLPYLPLVFEEEKIRLLRGIKKVFDSRGILNPGKIFEGGSNARKGCRKD